MSMTIVYQEMERRFNAICERHDLTYRPVCENFRIRFYRNPNEFIELEILDKKAYLNFYDKKFGERYFDRDYFHLCGDSLIDGTLKYAFAYCMYEQGSLASKIIKEIEEATL